MLIIPIQRKWFEMIVSGEKKQEYRDDTEYWEKRLKSCETLNVPGQKLRQAIIKNGYSKGSPMALITFTLDRGTGRPEWGAEFGKAYLRLNIRTATRITIEDYDEMKRSGNDDKTHHDGERDLRAV